MRMEAFCMHVCILAASLLQLHYTSVTATVDLNCGITMDIPQCPDDKQRFTCTVNSSYMQWESSAFKNDIEFFNKPIGTTKEDNGFTGTVTERSLTVPYTVSVLTFSVGYAEELNGVEIMCKNFYDGGHKSCIIEIDTPMAPAFIVNLHSIQLSLTDIKLAWSMGTATTNSSHPANQLFGNVTYTVTVWTASDNNTGTTLSWMTNATELVVQNIDQGLEYHWSVEAKNCIGWNKSIHNQTFQIISKVPNPVDSLNVCVYYSPTNRSLIADINWERSIVDYQFQSPLLYYQLYINNISNRTANDKQHHIQMKVSPDSIYYFTLTAISDIGASNDNPSVIIDTYGKCSVSTVLLGHSFLLIRVLIDNLTGCAEDSTYRVTINCTNMNMTDHNNSHAVVESEQELLYHTTADKEGKLVLVSDLQDNSMHCCTVCVYGQDNSLMMEPLQRYFTTKQDIKQKVKDNNTNFKTVPSTSAGSITGIITAATETAHSSLQQWTQHKVTETNSLLQTTVHLANGGLDEGSAEGEQLYSWLFLLIAVLIAFSVTLLLVVCLMSAMLFKMRKDKKRMIRSSQPTCKGLSMKTSADAYGGYRVNRNLLMMTDNNAYATVMASATSPCSSGDYATIAATNPLYSDDVELNKEEFRKRYLSDTSCL